MRLFKRNYDSLEVIDVCNVLGLFYFRVVKMLKF